MCSYTDQIGASISVTTMWKGGMFYFYSNKHFGLVNVLNIPCTVGTKGQNFKT